MFKLYVTESGQHRVISEMTGLDTVGTRDEAVAIMRSLDTEDAVIDEAFADMEERGNNLADFGMNMKTGLPAFIYSAKAVLDYMNVRKPVFIYESDTKAA